MKVVKIENVSLAIWHPSFYFCIETPSMNRSVKPRRVCLLSVADLRRVVSLYFNTNFFVS